MNEKDRGFTLIELLVVVVIIGVLAAIAIPVFLGQKQRAAEAATKSDLRNAVTYLETYFIEEGTYPSDGVLSLQPDYRGTEGVEVEVIDATRTGYCLEARNTTGRSYVVFSSDGVVRDGSCRL